jgi:hypothetical protein
MPAGPQIRKLLKPLLARHPDLFMVGRDIFVRPIRHISRAIILDRTSDPTRFAPTYHVSMTCHWIMIQWHRQLKHAPPGSVIWRWNHPDMPESLFTAIEDQALPALRAASTFADVEAFAAQNPWGYPLDAYHEPAMLFYAASGDKVRAQAKAHLLRNAWKTVDPKASPGIQHQIALLRAIRDGIAADDWQGVAHALHELERAVMAYWKLEPYWEPSPFPLEVEG